MPTSHLARCLFGDQFKDSNYAIELEGYSCSENAEAYDYGFTHILLPHIND